MGNLLIKVRAVLVQTVCKQGFRTEVHVPVPVP